MTTKTSNVTRTTALIKLRGNRYRIEERWNQYAGPHGRREDMWGIIDLIEYDPKQGHIGIQVCGSDLSAHIYKIVNERRADTVYWLRLPSTRLMIYSWRKLKLFRGSKAIRWTPKIVEITLQGSSLVATECPTIAGNGSKTK